MMRSSCHNINMTASVLASLPIPRKRQRNGSSSQAARHPLKQMVVFCIHTYTYDTLPDTLAQPKLKLVPNKKSLDFQPLRVILVSCYIYNNRHDQSGNVSRERG